VKASDSESFSLTLCALQIKFTYLLTTYYQAQALRGASASLTSLMDDPGALIAWTPRLSTGCAKKFYPMRLSDNFLEMAKDF